METSKSMTVQSRGSLLHKIVVVFEQTCQWYRMFNHVGLSLALHLLRNWLVYQLTKTYVAKASCTIELLLHESAQKLPLINYK